MNGIRKDVSKTFGNRITAC